MKLSINDSFKTALPADELTTTTSREVYGAGYSFVTPKQPPNPSLVHASEEVASLLGISNAQINSDEFLTTFSGQSTLPDTQPYAMAYGGHQFGHWAGQLGDGRAINLAEVVHNGQRYAMQLKGAGRTPYSRSGDGLAVLRSSVREHLCSEAMHYLGVPTTRSLSLMLTGESVLRDMFYNGNAAYEQGAVVCRVAPSFIRFGHFQLFAVRGDTDTLKILLDYTIEHFFPEVSMDDDQRYQKFFQRVVELTLDMVIHWQRVGFVHGVMNTDNMSILGLTIDYGPYGWTDDFNLNWTPNTTDKHQRRYRFGEQPRVALWNLWQLANALVSVVGKPDGLETSLQWYQNEYDNRYYPMMLAKIGLYQRRESDDSLIDDLEQLLQDSSIDMTIFFRQLSTIPTHEIMACANNEVDLNWIKNQLHDALYDIDTLNDDVMQSWQTWFVCYFLRVQLEQKGENTEETQAKMQARTLKMNQSNPKYVLRNYMAQLAIEAADNNDFSLINEMFDMLKKPYDEQPDYQKWFAKRPDWAKQKPGCSMLSCSS